MKFENINVYKKYGTKHCYFSICKVSKPYHFILNICGEQKCFDFTENGYNEMQKWASEKRQEILKEFGANNKE